MRALTVQGLLGLLAMVPLAAHAGGLVTPRGTTAMIERRTVLVGDVGDQQLWAEELEISGTAPRVGYLIPVPEPAAQARSVLPDAFEGLTAVTEIERPHHVEMQRALFGPSVVSAYRALKRRPRPEAEEEPRSPPPRIDPVAAGLQLYSGASTTSTITGARILPDAFEGWLQGEGFFLAYAQREALARYFDQGWSILAVAFSLEDRAILGPVLVRFKHDGLVDPGALSTTLPAPQRNFRLFTVAPQPVIPELRTQYWDPRPWLKEQPLDTQLHVTFCSPLSQELDANLATFAADLPEGHWVLRAQVGHLDALTGDLALAPKVGAPELPGDHRRGSGFDLFLCMLLGMMPIFYTPEAWFLMWLGYNARAQRKPRQPLPLRAHLWGVYGFIVALYWLATLDGPAKIAAIGPLLLGVGRLLIPDERESGPIRIDFRRKKKKEKEKEKAAPSLAPARASLQAAAPRSSIGPAGRSIPPAKGPARPPENK